MYHAIDIKEIALYVFLISATHRPRKYRMPLSTRNSRTLWSKKFSISFEKGSRMDESITNQRTIELYFQKFSFQYKKNGMPPSLLLFMTFDWTALDLKHRKRRKKNKLAPKSKNIKSIYPPGDQKSAKNEFIYNCLEMEKTFSYKSKIKPIQS